MIHDDNTPGLAASQYETFGDRCGDDRPVYGRAYACAQLPADLLPVLQGLRIGDDLLGALTSIEGAESLELLYGAQGRAVAFAHAALCYGDVPEPHYATLNQHIAHRVARRLAVLQGYSYEHP